MNNTGSQVSVNSVIIHFDTCTYDIWPHNVALPAGDQLIVTQTASGAGNGCTPGSGLMDSSDIGPGGAPWAGNCSQSGVIPEVDVTIDGTTSGQASFSYSSLSVGADTVQASVSNPVGQIPSNTVQVNWTVSFAPGGGAFVIGDNNSAAGTAVTFWGAQWWKLNSLSGGTAPAAFKGFALNPSTPSCAISWSTDPGNSAPPPAGPLPAYMAVIVSSSIAKPGSTISGNTPHIVIVKTNPGYASDPGHPGTGTVVSQVC